MSIHVRVHVYTSSLFCNSTGSMQREVESKKQSASCSTQDDSQTPSHPQVLMELLHQMHVVMTVQGHSDLLCQVRNHTELHA